MNGRSLNGTQHGANNLQVSYLVPRTVADNDPSNELSTPRETGDEPLQDVGMTSHSVSVCAPETAVGIDTGPTLLSTLSVLPPLPPLTWLHISMVWE